MILVCLLCAFVPAYLNASEKNEASPPNTVQDLRYGSVLYDFYQQNYFSALTQLWIAEALGDIKHHGDYPELLEGGISLSFGMDRQADEIFTRLLNEDLTQDERNKAWFYLAKIRYQRGEIDAAVIAIDKISGELPYELQAERVFMQISVLLKRGELEIARAQLATLDQRSPWAPYMYYNLGAAYLAQGEWKQGVGVLTKMNALTLDSNEHKTLRDRANTMAGYAYLDAAEYDLAIAQFLNIRLESPMVDQALLGYGWAAAKNGDYQRALKPWQVLAERSVLDPSVQEALIAIPHAYEELDALGHALTEFEHVAEVYVGELERLGLAINKLRENSMLKTFTDTFDAGADWFSYSQELPVNSQTPYLAHLIALQDFQNGLRDLRDLQIMEGNLAQWQGKLTTYRFALEARVVARDERLKVISENNYHQQLNILLQQRDILENQIAQAGKKDDGRELSSDDELALWVIIDRAEKRLLNLENADVPMDDERELLKRLRGLLSWNNVENYSERLWQTKKSLAALDKAIQAAQQASERLDQVVRQSPVLAQYQQRIETLQTRLDQQSTVVSTSVEAAQNKLRTLAINELEYQRQRLTQYLAEARLSVARLLDGVATEAVDEGSLP